jgi:hypothetical protein
LSEIYSVAYTHKKLPANLDLPSAWLVEKRATQWTSVFKCAVSFAIIAQNIPLSILDLRESEPLQLNFFSIRRPHDNPVLCVALLAGRLEWDLFMISSNSPVLLQAQTSVAAAFESLHPIALKNSSHLTMRD